MPIFYHEQKAIFHLQSKNMSYIIQILNGYPLHLYWGQKLRDDNNISRLSYLIKDDTLRTLPQEFPQYGTNDFRHPAYQAELEDGSRITEFTYTSHSIVDGKPSLDGLPSVYTESNNEAQTLQLELNDRYSGLSVILNYTIFENENALTRSARFIQKGEKPIRLLRALSASVDFHDSDLQMLYLSGASRRERMIQRQEIGPGSSTIESRRGASSHTLNPFLALVRPDTQEEHGEIYGFSFVYSGNFKAEVEVEQYFSTRVSMGINPFDFSWELKPNESFQTPEVVMVYSSQGIGEMSRTYHRLYRTRLCRGTHRDKERPILVNNWEATYFDFTEEKIESIAETAGELGIELLVLDDGWFGNRNDDTTSLGDWVVNRSKLPNGLQPLAHKVNKHGVQFGLWVEPEMISPDSELYRKHPDWCLHVEGRRRTEYRNQLILDLSRKEIRDYIFESLYNIFSTIPISYVKWDMNRNMTEIGSSVRSPSQQKETAHRYILGLYEILERITSAFPHILFEGCAGGGGRFDPGILYYMPQIWVSDNTDAIERQKIQYGTSIVYPVSTMGAHVSAVPNHQVGRITSLTTRGDVAMSGNFGYELDLTLFTNEEKEIAKRQIALYKEIRSLIQTADLYRLKSPFEGNETAWMFITPDKKEAIVFYFKTLAKANMPTQRLRLQGLNSETEYIDKDTGQLFGGDQLMYAGFPLPEKEGDFTSTIIRLKANF